MAPVTMAEMGQLAGHGAVLVSVAYLSSFLSLHSRIFDGINTYLHQDNINSGNGLRATVRPPSDAETPQTKRKSNKKKSAFDESAAQLLRLRLIDSHLRSRVYYSEYRRCFVSSISATFSLLLGFFFLKKISRSERPSVAAAGVPFLSFAFALAQILLSLARISFERSAATRLERRIAVLSGFVGFVSAVVIRSVLSPSVFEFSSGSFGISEIAVAALAGSLTVFLFLPAARSARSFWLGTDQLRWNLDFAITGKVSLILTYAAFIAGVVAPLMWIKPIVATDLINFRVVILAGSTLLQFLIMRSNLQIYLNESVLFWYQMLHSSKIPKTDLARAKLFLYNHNICIVILQFFAPAAMVTLFLGLHQMATHLSGDLASSARELALFFAWWISFVRAVYSIATLLFLRCGFLIVSW